MRSRIYLDIFITSVGLLYCNWHFALWWRVVMTQRRCILCSLVTFLILSHWRPSSADEGAVNSQTTGVLNHLFLHKRLFLTDHNLLPHGRRFVPYSGNRGKKATPARTGKSSYITWFNSLRISFAWSLPSSYNNNSVVIYLVECESLFLLYYSC